MSAAPDSPAAPAHEPERADSQGELDPAPPQSNADGADQHSLLQVFLRLAARWPHY